MNCSLPFRKDLSPGPTQNPALHTHPLTLSILNRWSEFLPTYFSITFRNHTRCVGSWMFSSPVVATGPSLPVDSVFVVRRRAASAWILSKTALRATMPSAANVVTAKACPSTRGTSPSATATTVLSTSKMIHFSLPERSIINDGAELSTVTGPGTTNGPPDPASLLQQAPTGQSEQDVEALAGVPTGSAQVRTRTGQSGNRASLAAGVPRLLREKAHWQ